MGAWSRAGLLLLLLTSPVHAQECSTTEAESLRAHLTEQQVKARQWNHVWRYAFATAAVASLGLAVTNPLPPLRDSFWLTAGKSVIATLSRWILPLRVELPPATKDVCADIAALRASITSTARQERRLFWMHHAGSIVLNTAGAVILALRGRPAAEIIGSAAVGYAVGLIATYTMPNASWKLWREHDWSVAYVPQNGGGVAQFGVTF